MPDYVERIAWDPNKVVSGARLRIMPGTYLNTSNRVFSGVTDVVIEWEPGAILRDNGYEINGVNGLPMRMPYGIEFDATCSKIQWFGRGLLQTGGGYGGSSAGYFDGTNYQERKPVLWFHGCRDVVFQSALNGDPGRAYSPIDPIIDFINPNMSLDAKAGVYARTFMVAFDNCRNVDVDILSFGPATRREQVFIGAGTQYFSFRAYDESSAAAATWASMAKFIGCKSGVIGPVAGLTASTSSVLDLIGSDVVVQNLTIDCPGKLVDISHEHGSRNQPMSNILVRDCVNDHPSGLVVSSVTNQSSQPDVDRSPVTNVKIESCRGGIRLGEIRDARVSGHEFIDRGNNAITLNGTLSQKIDYVDCIFRYTGASGSGRVYSVSDLVRFIGCRWLVTSGDTAPLVFKPNVATTPESSSPKRMEFHDCLLAPALTHQIECNVKFFDVDLTGVTIAKNGKLPSIQSYLPAPTTPPTTP